MESSSYKPTAPEDRSYRLSYSLLKLSERKLCGVQVVEPERFHNSATGMAQR